MFHPGEVVDGRYVVDGVLGNGNSGEAYRVRDRRTGEHLVLKIQMPRLFEDTASYEEYGNEILNEGSVGGQLSEVPGLVLARPGGDHIKRQYVVMPDVGGRDLVDFAADEGAVSSLRTAAIIAQLCGTLGELHAREWFHRDIKAENTLIAPDGRVWLIDLGSAVRRDVAATPQGTVGYSAPEVMQGAPATVASDVFSLGCLLFKLAIMNLPYANETGLPPAPDPPFPDRLKAEIAALAPQLRAVGFRMIAWDPADRPQSADEVVGELAGLLPGPAAPPRPGREPDPVLRYWLARHQNAS
ncbi:serine/threonine-protein kinase [Amycolatopsis sp. SID8362]|uniref:serine/threonine protein kinase n=1 Tax=Amycolatopsis sp. SID8362 TaxID=2690346 RepID=UPI0013697FAC|nr:serine/threonine-protein kinase [Amycolatopsis sp. SID8362]NBH10350.1 protein kinase [Amycolatopsis sp. SID8362]NED47045.1 serine/threonine protein kinase [Amycolatopsis sp. SID8362]